MTKASHSGTASGQAFPEPVSITRLALLAGLAALGSLATNIILPAFPQMGADLGVTERELGLTLSSFFVAFAVGQLFVGPVSDRYGRKLPVLFGIAGFAAGSLLCATASSLEIMIAGRIIQALGACATSVLSRAIARDLYDGETLARVLALVMVAMAAAPGFSPFIGSILNQAFGWPVIFAAIAIISGLLGWQYASTIGETRPNSASEPSPLSRIVVSYSHLACDARFMFPALSVSLIIGCLYTFFATAPAVLISVLGLTGFQLSLYFAATVIIVFSAGFLAPRLARRYGPRAAAMAGAVIASIGALFMLAVSASPDLWSLTTGLCIFLFGMGLINPLGTAITLQPFASQAGLASALLGFFQMGCAAIGATLASLIPFPPAVSLALIMCAGTLSAAILFVPAAKQRPLSVGAL